MKPLDFELAFLIMMMEFSFLKESNSSDLYVWNIISLCLYFWGFGINEVDEARRTFVEITNGKRHYDESNGKVALISFVKENYERRILFITHLATVAASQSGDITNEQLNFIRSLATSFEISEEDTTYSFQRGVDLATAVRFIVQQSAKAK